MNRIQDIQTKAKTGIKVGDIQKEAHMAYCMAMINENQKNYAQAVKFFKRFYFCSKLLDDPEGVEIALNKITICYLLQAKFDQSMAFAHKHMKFL